jgi:hypothetical protein
MLTTRSKVLITIVAGWCLISLFSYALSAGTWNPEPDAEDWYISWIILGVLILGTIVSIVIDVRRNRMSS